MFGYVRIDQPRMTCGDFELYRGAYCSLCRALGRRYGPFGRLALTYDMAFFALLALSQQEDCPGFQRGHCSFNPTKRCLKLPKSNPSLALAADISMLMACEKWRDNMTDSHFWGKLLWALPGVFFLWAGRRAAKRAPQAAKIIRTAMQAQLLVEQSAEAPSLDQCAHPSAHALGALCALLSENLYRLGYLLGRWVYLIDAADDYNDDLKRYCFNAFSASSGNMKEALAATSCELLRCWKSCKTERFQPIFDNILMLGLPQMERNILEKGAKSHEKPV